MIALDTDHLTVLAFPEDSRNATLTRRMASSTDPRFVTAIVSVEEQMSGWLAEIDRRRDVHQQIPAYERFARLIDFFGDWEIVSFDGPAADEFKRLRKQRIRAGTQDLKIASIVLRHDALLLTANLRDFGRVPGLRVENWLE
jgi:tRNA(fMet)-specific endonuclease VapC